MKGKNPEDDKLINELLKLGELHPTDKVYDENGDPDIVILSTSKFINRKSKDKNNDRVEWKVDDPFIIGDTDKKPTINGFTEEKTTGTINIGDTVISKGFMHGGLLPEGNEYVVKSISSAIGELRGKEYFLRLKDTDAIGHNSKNFTL